MEGKLISVIIPCYNVENFLDDCVKSLMAQSYKNFEAILVNDGSKDKTLDRIKAYCEQDSRFKFIDKPNGGLSSARNAGIAIAKGEYVYFYDSDDYIAPNLLEVSQNALSEENVDFVSFKAKWVKEKDSFDVKNFKNKKTKLELISGADEIMSAYFCRKLNFTVCCKMYKHSVMKEIEGYPNLFNEKTRYAEDIEFNTKYIEKSSNAIFIKSKLYMYRQRKGSLVHSSFNEGKLSIFNAFELTDKLDNEKFKEGKKYANSHKCVMCLEMLFRIAKAKKESWPSDEKIKKLYSDFKENLKYVTKGKKNPFYLKFLPAVIPYFKLKFRKNLKQKNS